MKKTIALLLLFLPLLGISQYTDVINSNRPGQSISAYAIGKNVVQIETGINYEHKKHNKLLTNSKSIGADFALRYGLLFEQLEVYWEGTFINEKTIYTSLNEKVTRTNFSRNRAGLKFLIFDPFKNPERNKPNFLSWKANHTFQFKNLLPAVSISGGANFNLADNPFFREDPEITYRGLIATQSRLSPRFVLITNFSYDKISSDDPEMSYIVSISRALKNPKWSVFIEHQGIKSDRYSDMIIRTGGAYLMNDRLQIDANFAGSFKHTPSRFYASIGGSYRFDFHKDKLVPIQEQEAGENGGNIKKNSMKKKKKEKPKKQRKKKKKPKNGEIDF